ncbi:MAG: DNA alkylation repair protein [Thermoanaerobaculia bacterium]
MTFDETIGVLERAGTAQNQKVYARHGVKGAMYGVSYAVQRDLAKKIKVDHTLASQVWETGNHDARILATLVADPAALGRKRLEAWARELDNYIITDAVASVASRSPEAPAIAKAWIASKQEWISSADWTVVANLAMQADGAGDTLFEGWLPIIESRIGKAPNRTRHAMNSALIAIGIRGATLERKAVAAATAIGKVEVDHGETGCKTPDAVPYIRKARARKK